MKQRSRCRLFTMLASASCRVILLHLSLLVTATTSATSASQQASSSSPSSSVAATRFKLLQVQVVHRHGDRTPITPLLDQDFWHSKLVPQSTFDKISSNTFVLRDDTMKMKHGAKGRKPFGQLTQLGLLQMIRVGSTLRERYSSGSDWSDNDNNDNAIWTPFRPLHPSTIRVYSTDFDRTIQSVQGLLVGLLSDEKGGGGEGNTLSLEPGDKDNDNNRNMIFIDARHTQIMIPDPLPRQFPQQVLLERTLAEDPVVQAKERQMMPLAVETSRYIQPLLAPDAHKVSFGLEEEHPGDEEIEVEPLAWNQLAEICKCLLVYDKLPREISHSNVEAIMEYAAQRWFRNLDHPRLNALAMNALVSKQLEIFLSFSQDEQQQQPPPVMTIWSAHDSTLIGLLCAYRLEKPAQWPEYGSHLVLELLQKQHQQLQQQQVDRSNSNINDSGNANNGGELYVRFSLNGEYLRSKWQVDQEPMDMVPLQMLIDRVQQQQKDMTSPVVSGENDKEESYSSTTRS